MAVSTYYKLRERGLTPEEHCPPGTKLVRLSPEAISAWRKKNIERLEDNPVRMALREKSKKAGKISVLSPKHYCHRGKKESKQRGGVMTA